MSNFNRLLLSLHAEARRCDRDQALLGALGVGAFAYPHQLESVRRMLTAPTCRWLLCDEVGLGKTVQAIMVMRALAAQSPHPFVTALVVPDNLVEQWESELLARGHAIALEAGQDGEPRSNLVIRLGRPSRIASGSRIVPEKIDLLLIDEFTKLPASVRGELVAASRAIPNVVVMTATPALHKPDTRIELLDLVEPEAARIARAENRSVLSVLSEREEVAADRFSYHTATASDRRSIEENYGVYRRLIRTRRTDYPEALPQRVYQPIRVAPTEGDVQRAKVTRAYIEAADASGIGLQRDALLQVAGRSPQSLRDRLSTLNRTQGVQSAWQQIDSVLRKEPGAAKLDALVDHLRGKLARNPSVRVVIVAEDNPTTDYLHDALSKLIGGTIARMRRIVAHADELEEQIYILQDAIEDFVSGEANILIASVDAREGHNLQFADEIIFFALPWSPHDIQQWIGRIDRLGTRGDPSRRSITITPIVVEGSIEARILDVLEATNVFNSSDVYDESEWAQIAASINAAAEGRPGGSWGLARSHASQLSGADSEWLGSTVLPPSSRNAIAAKLKERLDERNYACPLTATDQSWFHQRESGLDLLLALSRMEYFDIRKGTDGPQVFRTIWYLNQQPDLFIPEIDSSSSFYRQAFIADRGAILCPPATHIEQSDQVKRLLHFLDHGCALHDQIIEALCTHAIPTDIATEFTIAYPAGHPILTFEDRRLLVAVTTVEQPAALFPELEAVIAKKDPTKSRPEQDAHDSCARRLGAAIAADRRWFLDRCPPEFLVSVLVSDHDGLRPAPDVAAAILDPRYGRECARQITRRQLPFHGPAREQATAAATRDLTNRGNSVLGKWLLALRDCSDRMFEIESEIEAQVAAARAELRNAEQLDRTIAFNQAVVRGATLGLALAERSGAARRSWVSGLEAAVKNSTRLAKPRFFWIVPVRRV